MSVTGTTHSSTPDRENRQQPERRLMLTDHNPITICVAEVEDCFQPGPESIDLISSERQRGRFAASPGTSRKPAELGCVYWGHG